MTSSINQLRVGLCIGLLHTGSGAVMHPDSFVDFSAI